MSEATQTATPDVPGHRVHGVLGQGATSIVWAGSDAVGRPVAIKVPRAVPDAIELAQSEIERHVLLAVRHDHLVPLRDVVSLADGRTALVFDQVTGSPLSAMVGMRGHLRAGEVVTVLTPLAQAVAALHTAGGTHGDISPRNVMLTSDGRPLLLDLGAARLAGVGSGAVHGTPGFVAPEVRAGGLPGEASDVFALGAVAWFCATGNGAPDTDIRLDLETVQSHVGPELADVIGAAIDPDPERRPSSHELARLFYDAAPAEPVEVVLGTDDASALTHRLRAEAAGEAPQVVMPSWFRRVADSLKKPWSGLSARLAGRGGNVVAFPLWGSRRARVLAAAAAVAAALAAAAWVVVPRSSAADSGVTASHDAPRAAARTSGAPNEAGATKRPTTAMGAGAPLAAATAPRTHAVELMQLLSDARGSALSRRDIKALDLVYTPSSTSRAEDVSKIATLRSGGNTYSGLRLEVAQATWVAGNGRRATIRARVDWTAYVVVNDSGARGSEAAQIGEVLDFHLVRSAGGWRIQSITRGSAT